MKPSTFLAGLGCLAHIASARHGPGQAHRRAHASALDARQDVVVVVTQTFIEHTTITEGEPAPERTEASGNVKDAAPVQPPAESKPVQQASAGKPNDGGPRAGASYGVTYSPLRGDGQCKSAEDIGKDFATFKGVYSTVRLYGVECDVVSKALPAAKEIDIQLMLGIYDIGPERSVADARKIIAAVGGDWAYIHSVSIGNEAVESGRAGVDAVVQAVGAVRGVLRDAGFGGPVLTVDTFIAVIRNPALCAASDYCGVNMHPFFDSSCSAAQAGEFMTEKLGEVMKVAGGKPVYITETGWPWNGIPNDKAVPSLGGQSVALSVIKGAFENSKDRLFLFASFNERWKDPGTFNQEKYWGIGGGNPPSES